MVSPYSTFFREFILLSFATTTTATIYYSSLVAKIKLSEFTGQSTFFQYPSTLLYSTNSLHFLVPSVLMGFWFV